MRAISVSLAVTVFAVALGCGDDDDEGSVGAGGTAGTGGSAGNTDGSVGTAGAGGTGGTGGGGTGLEDGGIDSSFDPSTVDLTLGGFNQDLPEPSVNCFEQDPTIGCIAVSGEVNGEAFDLFCDQAGTTFSSSFGLNCIEEQDWDVDLGYLRPSEIPSTFSYQVVLEDTEDGWVFFTWQGVRAYSQDNWARYGKNFQEARIAGWEQRRTDRPASGRTVEVKGTFAATWTAPDMTDPECSSNGCLEARIRGNFHAFGPD